MEKVKKFWETCNLNFSHNEIYGHLKNYEYLTNSWENAFISKIDFTNKTLLDYGIGGGYLGKYLFENKKLNSYIGIDISERSLKKAKEVLREYNHKLYDCDYFYSKFNDSVDIIVCQACIQHFPSEECLNNFLIKINNLKAKTKMLQIAHNKQTKFKKNNYSTMHDVLRTCYTNKEYILQFLNKYKCTYESSIAENNYQFLIFEEM